MRCKEYNEEITDAECIRRRTTAEKMVKFLDKGFVVRTATYSTCLSCNHSPSDPVENKIDLKEIGFNAEGILKALGTEGDIESVAKEKINPEGKTCVDCGKPATEGRFNFKYDRCQYHARQFAISQPNYQPRKKGGTKIESSEQVSLDSNLDINFCPFCGANLTTEGSIMIASTNHAHKSLESSKLVYDSTDSRTVACVGCGKKLK